MIKYLRFLTLLFLSTNGLYSQDYFPLVKNSYWIYDVYNDGVFSYKDSVVHNSDVTNNDTLFYMFIHYYKENGIVTDSDTLYLYENKTDKNTIMLSNRNFKGVIVDSAIYAKLAYKNGDWWKYKNQQDTIKVKSIGEYTVTSGTFQNCFMQGDEYIFAPGVGIIKIYLWNSISYYDLIRYHISTQTSLKKIDTDLQINIFPNPVVDFIHFDTQKSFTYTIVDNKGAVCKTGMLKNGLIDASSLQPGFYFIRISNNKDVKIFKVLKK